MAHSAANGGEPRGVIHAFEPMEHAYNQLVRNLQLNQVTNVVTHRLGLWDHSDLSLSLDGDLALASSVPVDQVQGKPGEVVKSITIDSYVHSQQLPKVDLIMLDTEGGEEQALRGAIGLLARPRPESPHIVFEVHRHFTDWSDGLENTPIVQLLTSHDYTVFAIRDFHNNYPMAGYPVEIIPVDCVYLEGPPHGFNLLATKDSDLVRRLGLRIVKNVSPKLLLNRDPTLHQPLHTSL
jgi:FkbM family methyltransferase